MIGDLVTLELEERPLTVDVVVRRASFETPSIACGGTPVARMVPELVPLIARACRGGVICHREHLVFRGARLRLRATVERARSGSLTVAERLVVRDDLARVRLDEVLEHP